MYDFIIKEFYQKMANIDLNAYGILDTNNQVHTLGTDSKIIGRLFEIFTQPVLSEIAAAHSLILETPKAQTAYPDFILMKDKESKEKIAIDVKTTYVTSDSSSIKFTLGSYCSYMRNNKKNIQYLYTDYVKHFVIGFVYKRNGAAQESIVYRHEDRNKIVCPYSDVRYFIQEKYKISGDKPGSGNTENIGSFPTKNFDDLKDGKGPFSKLGADVFDLYWKYYPKYRSKQKPYKSLSEFIQWAPKQKDLQLLYPCDYKKLMKKITTYTQTDS